MVALIATATKTRHDRKIFISHSHADLTLCRKLADALRDNSYEPFMDVDDIRAGSDWEYVINQELNNCHAAVVIISEAALRSRWVRREVNILLWRRALSPGFTVIPVLIGSMSVDQLEATDLDELQRVEVLRLGEHNDQLVIDQILRELPSPALHLSADPLTRWIAKLSREFHRVPDSDRDTLHEAAKVMGVRLDRQIDWRDWEGAQYLAHQLLGTGLVDSRLERALTLVADVLRSRDELSRLVQLALPAWVDAEAASRMLPSNAGKDPDRVVVLMDVNGADMALDYLARAMCTEYTRYQQETVQQMPVGEESVADLVGMWTASVRRMLGLTSRDPLNRGTPRARDKVYYLVADCGDLPYQVIANAIEQMHEACPWLMIVLVTARREAFERQLRDRGCDNVRSLRPPLTAHDEIRARQTRKTIIEMPTTVFGRG